MPSAPSHPNPATEAYVLDSYAYLAYLWGEPNGQAVADLLGRATRGEIALHMSTVTVAEVMYIVWRRRGEQVARRSIDSLRLLGVAIHEADLTLSMHAAALKAHSAIALGDTFVAALAQRLGAAVVTGDPEFRQVEDVVEIEWL